jgi:hypothetical protein
MNGMVDELLEWNIWRVYKKELAHLHVILQIDLFIRRLLDHPALHLFQNVNNLWTKIIKISDGEKRIKLHRYDSPAQIAVNKPSYQMR